MAPDDWQLQSQVSRLQRHLPASTIDACNRVAWRVRWRLPSLLASRDWEATLLREVRRELAFQLGVPAGQVIVAAILAVIAAVMIIIGQTLSKEEEQHGTKEKVKEATTNVFAAGAREPAKVFQPGHLVTAGRPESGGKYYLVAVPHSHGHRAGGGGYASVRGRGRLWP
jgi:hypothetical protein